MDGKTLVIIAVAAGLGWWLGQTFARQQVHVPTPVVPVPQPGVPDPRLRIELPPDPQGPIWT